MDPLTEMIIFIGAVIVLILIAVIALPSRKESANIEEEINEEE